MALTYHALTSPLVPAEFSGRLNKVLNTPLTSDVVFDSNAGYPSRAVANRAYGAAHMSEEDKKNQNKWSALDFIVLVIVIVGVLAYIGVIAGAAYTTSERPTPEMVWSILMAIFVPEVWVCWHGIDSTRNNVSFFEKLPAVGQVTKNN